MRTSFLSDDFVDPIHGFNYNNSSPCKVKQPLRNVLDVPLITVNKIVFRSKLENGTYKPMDLLSYANLLRQLKEQQNTHPQPPTKTTRQRSTSVQIKEKVIILLWYNLERKNLNILS